MKLQGQVRKPWRVALVSRGKIISLHAFAPGKKKGSITCVVQMSHLQTSQMVRLLPAYLSPVAE